MKRRYFLASSAATLATPALARICEDDIRLCEVAPQGMDISSFHRPSQTPASLRLIRKHCSVVVPEFGLKPQHAYYDGQKGCYDDDTVRLAPHWPEAAKARFFSDQSGMGFHAHTLYWPKHNWPSCFMFSRNMQRTFIQAFAKQICGAKTCDVLNEVLWKDKGEEGNKVPFALYDDETTDFSLFENWSQVLTIDNKSVTPEQHVDFLVFIIKTLRSELVKLNSAGTKLLINEDQLTWPDKGPMIKRKAMLGLLDYMVSQDARLDGVGLQGHIRANRGVDANGTKKFIQDLGKKNYVVHFSELDYDNTIANSSAVASDEDHATALSDLLAACLPEDNVKRVGFWGFLDAEHRLFSSKPNARPALFDIQSKAKPVFCAVAHILSAQRAR